MTRYYLCHKSCKGSVSLYTIFPWIHFTQTFTLYTFFINHTKRPIRNIIICFKQFPAICIINIQTSFQFLRTSWFVQSRHKVIFDPDRQPIVVISIPGRTVIEEVGRQLPPGVPTIYFIIIRVINTIIHLCPHSHRITIHTNGPRTLIIHRIRHGRFGKRGWCSRYINMQRIILIRGEYYR